MWFILFDWAVCLVLIYSAVPGPSCGTHNHCCSMQDPVPWPGIEPRPPALGAWSRNHWITREVLVWFILPSKWSSNFLHNPRENREVYATYLWQGKACVEQVPEKRKKGVSAICPNGPWEGKKEEGGDTRRKTWGTKSLLQAEEKAAPHETPGQPATLPGFINIQSLCFFLHI